LVQRLQLQPPLQSCAQTMVWIKVRFEQAD
jgi:hypothetical protein